jgi:hypothetical protein
MSKKLMPSLKELFSAVHYDDEATNGKISLWFRQYYELKKPATPRRGQASKTHLNYTAVLRDAQTLEVCYVLIVQHLCARNYPSVEFKKGNIR